ncbi:MAG: PaaI family thioesterase [Deltaproteobacteria bacterium]|nr:PaaI family thioesterase [Deltaproteobacteria bacterium]
MTPKGVGLNFLKTYFDKDSFARHCGIELIEAANGHAEARLNICGYHLNGLGMIHGGVLFTLADLAFAAAVHSRGRVAVSINNSISYIKAAQGKVLIAQADEISSNHRIASYRVNILDEPADIIAVFQGLAYLKNRQIGGPD